MAAQALAAFEASGKQGASAQLDEGLGSTALPVQAAASSQAEEDRAPLMLAAQQGDNGQ